MSHIYTNKRKCIYTCENTHTKLTHADIFIHIHIYMHTHTLSGQGLFPNEVRLFGLLSVDLELVGVYFVSVCGICIVRSPLIVSGLLLAVASLPTLTVLMTSVGDQWPSQDNVL